MNYFQYYELKTLPTRLSRHEVATAKFRIINDIENVEVLSLAEFIRNKLGAINAAQSKTTHTPACQRGTWNG